MPESISCPNCNQTVYLKSALKYDDDFIKVLGVYYLLECQYCKHKFTTELRKGENIPID